jgi:hypothetical protein
MTCRLEGRFLRFEVVMGQSELDHQAQRLKFERHPRWAFAAVLLADQHVKGIGKQARPLRLQYFTLPINAAVFPYVFNRRTDLPIGFNASAAPIPSSELAVGQRLPQLLGCRRNIGDVDKSWLVHLIAHDRFLSRPLFKSLSARRRRRSYLPIQRS